MEHRIHRDRITGYGDRDRSGTRLSPALARWIARSRREANLEELTWLALSMLALTMTVWVDPDGVSSLRYIAIVIAGVHGVQHLVWIETLRRLHDRGVAKAETALRVYLDPLRITCLDLAMAWVGFGAFVPIVFRLLVAG